MFKQIKETLDYGVGSGVREIDEESKGHSRETEENKEDMFKNPFYLVRGEEAIIRLKGITSERLREALKMHPEISYAVYEDILLQEKDLKKEMEASYRSSRLLDSPKTPICQWKVEVLGFTELTVEVCRRISCILRGNSMEIRSTEILELLRKLEHICTGNRFSVREKELSASLLSISVGTDRVNSVYSMYICGFLYSIGYPFSNEVLSKHLDRHQNIREVCNYVCERRVSYSWIVLRYLNRCPEQVGALFSLLKDEICSLVGDEDKLIEVLKPIYIYSTEELEEKMKDIFKEHYEGIIRKCQERIW
ncbi:hypothetical protein NEFER03_0897 [Nematocida sp. LUAm3]|nr:hypothetical protein NEFER03_0897 [Nematocida sp. LUAm3]KAI5174915.1 hypothetical protein NEFER02_1015 [Nematocida sp. LUAm2]KAI5177486.1 hypothetical protein NEFER01_0736 [Nematocida sp. LUAm1]